MIYFVTGASGFIGKRLVRALLTRPDATVYVLRRETDTESLGELRRFWQRKGRASSPTFSKTHPCPSLSGRGRATARSG